MEIVLLCLAIISVQASQPEVEGPSFLAEPPDLVMFSNSTGIVIPCSTSGRPSANVTWRMADGEVATDIDGLRRIRPDGSLVFLQFPSEHYRAGIHSATYHCIARNAAGAIVSRDVHVRAVVWQHYDVRLSDEFVIRGNTAVLRCPIPSFVADHVQVKYWERSDGFIIKPDIASGKYGFLDNGDLYVLDVGDGDIRDSFTCITEDKVTKDKKTSNSKARIIITEPPRSQPPRIVRRSGKVTVSANQRAVLACISHGHPRPQYRWLRRTGHHLTMLDFGVRVHQEGGVLVFHRALPSDTGRYTCHVSNNAGDDRTDMEIIVREPLSVSVSPAVVEADVGDSVEFRCTVASEAHLAWLKNVQPILADHNTIIMPNPTVLRLVHVKREDEGMFQCFARQGEESAQGTARLIISDVAPKLKTVFTSKTVAPGTYVSLSCTATGKPLPEIQWRLDNAFHLTTKPGLMMRSNAIEGVEVVSSVNFTLVNVSDSGLYSCSAVNEAGLDSHSARLNVYGPLFVRNSHRNITTLAGSNVTVMCPFGGYPFDVVSWKKDGRLLPLNQRQRIYPNGTFVIHNVQQGQDDGPYTCHVSTRQGSSPASGTIVINIRTGPRVSPFEFRSDLHEGMRTAITCVVIAGDIPYTIRWTKDGHPLRDGLLDAAIHYPENGFVSTLSIDRLAYRHNGRYTCLATNDVATGSYTATLTVKVPPRWIVEPQDTSTISGRPAKVDCQADGVPQPHIRWKKTQSESAENFQTIVSSSHVHTLVNGTLNFQKIERSDVGFYLCEANNGVGVGLNHVIRLTVHSGPQVSPSLVEVTARRGQRTRLSCDVKGEKPIRFLWSKSGQPIEITPAETRFSEETEETGIEDYVTKLVFYKVERQDTAVYTCFASNDYGEDTSNIQLTVQDIPDAPQNVEVHEISSRSVRLTWQAPFDGNLPITSYTIAWRQLTGQSAEDPQIVGGSEKTYTVRGLRPFTRYFFRVKGDNELGASQFSAEVAATTLQEPPNVAPRLIKVVPLSSNAVNVTWQIESSETINIQGFHVGYKMKNSLDPFILLNVPFSQPDTTGLQSSVLSDLKRFTEYAVVLRAFNERGAGPPSQEVSVKTFEFDPPSVPKLTLQSVTSKSIKLSWEVQHLPDSPVSGCLLFHRTEYSTWQETRLVGQRNSHSLQNLLCGTSYYIFIVAYNSVGRSNSSDIVTARTSGTAPIAPEKKSFLTVNSTCLSIDLDVWKDGACPILSVTLWYRQSRDDDHEDYTLFDNEQITGLVVVKPLFPGTWYHLKMVVANDAGTTEEEYDFATLTVSGEYPPTPTEIRSGSGSYFYNHMTVTLSLVSLALLLVFVALGAACFVTRRRMGSRRHNNPDGAESSGTAKYDMPLSVTYEGAQGPNYFPSAYSTSHVYQRSYVYREKNEQTQCLQKLNMEAIDNGAEAFSDQGQTGGGFRHQYESPTPQSLIFQERVTRSEKHQAIYEVPDRGRKAFRNSRDSTECSSSAESNIEEDRAYAWQQQRDDCRHSETECDRLWKAFGEKQFEGRNRFDTNHVVMS